MDVKQGHSGDTSGHGLSGSGLQSQRFPQASRQASASTDRTQRPLTGPKVWPARRDLDPRPRVCGAGGLGWGACGTGCISGGGDPGLEDLREKGPDVCVWGSRSSASASAKGKGAPVWQGMGSSSRAQREPGSWPGSALPPGHRPHRLPGNGLQRQNGQRREITVEFIGCDSIRREHRQRPRHAGGGAGVGTDGRRAPASVLSSARGRPARWGRDASFYQRRP